MTIFSHTAGKYIPKGNFPALPAGKYKVKISESEIKPNSKGTGSYLKLVFDVWFPGEHKGGKFFENLNVQHTDLVTRKIAENNLNGILNSIGLQKISNTDQLIGNDLIVEVDVKIEAEKERNKVIKYFPINEPISQSIEKNCDSDEFMESDIPF